MNGVFYIETYGCQMNTYDSELVAGILSGEGYSQTSVVEDADIILVNTCAVRDHAERRVFGRLGELKRIRDAREGRIFVLCGCMAQRLGEEVFERVSHVDLVVGPGAYRHLPDLIRRLNGRPAADLRLPVDETYTTVRPMRTGRIKAWVAIMRGCDNFCSYCIVPSVRGRARSRPAADILREVEDSVRDGYTEVTLLGQNVNAYSFDGIGFGELLRMLNAVAGLERIRFTTSHPKDMTSEIIEAVAEGDHICEHLHLPVQSGSTRILRAMNRQYTAEEYLRLIQTVRETVPGVSITTDIIVGFPGETEEDFRETLKMVETVGFDSAFTFKYSPRPGTRASELEDSVPEAAKGERLEHLIAVQRSITDRKNKELVGREVEILVEGESRRGGGQLVGRTRTDKTVVFNGERRLAGSCVQVSIDGAKGWTLWGRCTGARA